MDKLTIARRANWEGGFYIQFKAEEKSMKTIKKMIEDFGSEHFVDNQAIPKTLSKYEKWKDQWIPIYSSKNHDLYGDIICGDKIIHMVIHKCPSFEWINNILNKYSNWAQIKYKKGFGPEHKKD